MTSKELHPMEIITSITENKTMTDKAKRQALEAMNIPAPDNGFRIVLDVQYAFDFPNDYKPKAVTNIVYQIQHLIDAAIREAEKGPNAANYINKHLRKIANISYVDVEYCDDWVDTIVNDLECAWVIDNTVDTDPWLARNVSPRGSKKFQEKKNDESA